VTSEAPRKRNRRRPEERRAQILDAAVRLIGERGFYGFSIRELAHRCEMTDPGLLHHFGSKEALLVALLDLRDQRDTEVVPIVAGVPAEARAGVLTRRQVLDLLRAIVLRNTTQPEFVRLYAVLEVEALNAAHPAHGYFRARMEAVVSNFAGMIAPHAEAPRSTAVQLVALMKGLELEWLRSGQTLDIVAEWDAGAARLLPPG
jgi:AcrR family transcriptional regulator